MIVLKPTTIVMVGKNTDSILARFTALLLYDSLFALKKLIIAFSCTKDLITLMPEYDSCAVVVISESTACTFSLFL